jgi:hypothetical protein
MGDRDEAGRILGSVETVICHCINTPEQIVALAGTRQALDYSSCHTPEGASGHGTTRIRHQLKIDPNRVRALAPGAAYVINCGRAMKVAVLRAPDACSTLPAPRGDAEDSDCPDSAERVGKAGAALLKERPSPDLLS